jgi:hypothetical protein
LAADDPSVANPGSLEANDRRLVRLMSLMRRLFVEPSPLRTGITSARAAIRGLARTSDAKARVRLPPQP